MLGTAPAKAGIERTEIEDQGNKAQKRAKYTKSSKIDLVNEQQDLTNVGLTDESLDEEMFEVKKSVGNKEIDVSRQKKHKLQEEEKKVGKGGGLKATQGIGVDQVYGEGTGEEEKTEDGYENQELKADLKKIFDGDNYIANDDFYEIKNLKGMNGNDLSTFEFHKELENLSSLANSLRQQYRELERVGVTEAIENFTRYKAASEEKIQSCQEYSDYLEKKVEDRKSVV